MVLAIPGCPCICTSAQLRYNSESERTHQGVMVAQTPIRILAISGQPIRQPTIRRRTRFLDLAYQLTRGTCPLHNVGVCMSVAGPQDLTPELRGVQCRQMMMPHISVRDDEHPYEPGYRTPGVGLIKYPKVCANKHACGNYYKHACGNRLLTGNLYS